MKMRSIRNGTIFEAELTQDHPASVPGPLAFRRKDNGQYIAMRDVWTIPGHKFDIIEATKEERSQLEKEGLITFWGEAVELTELPELSLNFPKHESKIRALGYAFGMSAGIMSPAYHGQMPPLYPIHAKGRLSTNDPEAFNRVFYEGHEPGFQFGKKAARELMAVLRSNPANCQWPICLLFAEQTMINEDYVPEDVLAELDEHIRQGLDAFHRIYQRHLL